MRSPNLMYWQAADFQLNTKQFRRSPTINPKVAYHRPEGRLLSQRKSPTIDPMISKP